MESHRPLIVADHLSRYYKVQTNALRIGRFGSGLLRRDLSVIKAIDDISFTIDAASSVGLIGLNGAGKSTLLKLITGVLVPSRGRITVDGLVPADQRKQVARRVGVVFGHRTQLWWDVPLMDSMNVLRRVYSVDKRIFSERPERLSSLLELGPLLGRAPRQLSLGQRVRAEIMASLLHGPSLLILDEPTVGLDIIAKASIRTLVRSLVADEGVTVILASHEVTDIEEIYQRAILIHHGKILYDGSLETLKSQAAVERSLVVELVPGGEDGAADGERRVETVTIPLRGVDSGVHLDEIARRGTVVNAYITGGSPEVILARMFGAEVARQ